MPRIVPRSPEWLTEALRGSGALGEGRVASVQVSPVGAGAGLLGSLARLELTYEGASRDLPASVVAKFPAEAEVNRGLARQYRVYEREYRFYAEVAPAIRTRIPAVHHSALDAETGDAVILLEDLGDALADLGLQHGHGGGAIACGVADPREHVGDGVVDGHRAWVSSPGRILADAPGDRCVGRGCCRPGVFTSCSYACRGSCLRGRVRGA